MFIPPTVYRITFFFWIFLGLGVWQGCRSSEKPWMITWQNGQFDRAQYDEWLKFIDLVDSETAIKELVLVLHLAEEAKRKGVDREPEIKIALETSIHRIYGDRLRQQVFSNTQVDPQVVTQLREQHPEAFKKPPKWKLRQIYQQQLPGRTEHETIANLEGLRNQVLNGGSFEELAKQYSQSQTRFTGGRLGWVDLETFPPTAQDVLRDLKAGEVSQIATTGKGWSFFLCEDLRQAENPTPEEVEAKIRLNLHRQKAKQAWQQMSQSLREKW